MCDSLIIQNVEFAWQNRRSDYVLCLIRSDNYTSGEKLRNPSKAFFPFSCQNRR